MLHYTSSIGLAGMFTFAVVLAVGGLATSSQAQPLAALMQHPNDGMLVQSTQLQTAESHAEARLWLVVEEGGGDGGGHGVGGDGGDSFRLLPPRKKMKRRTNIRPMALRPRDIDRKRRIIRSRLRQPGFQPTVTKINPNNLRPAPGKPKGPLSVHPGLNPTSKKGNRKGIATLIPGVTRGVHQLNPPINLKNNAYARADFSRLGRNAANNNRTARARGRARTGLNHSGGGSRACSKMVTVVVDGTPRRIRVKAPGSC